MPIHGFIDTIGETVDYKTYITIQRNQIYRLLQRGISLASIFTTELSLFVTANVVAMVTE
jgi:hypothetical protein